MSSSTATNNNCNLIPSSTINKNYLKPPFVNKTLHSVEIIVKNASKDYKKDFVSCNKNKIQINVMNTNHEITSTQNNNLGTTNNSNSNNKTFKKGSVNSNHSYLLNFKEKQKMSNSNSNIDKKGEIRYEDL